MEIGKVSLFAVGCTIIAVMHPWDTKQGWQELADKIRAEHVQLVVQSIEDDSGIPWKFTATGYDPDTQIATTYSPTMGRWCTYLRGNLELGDTLIKRSDDLSYLIKKSNENIVLPFEAKDIPQAVLKLAKNEQSTKY